MQTIVDKISVSAKGKKQFPKAKKWAFSKELL